MASNKKKRSKNKRRKKPIPKQDIVFVYEVVPAEESLFPEKVREANEMLSKAELLPR